VYHQYVVRSSRRDALRSYLRENGVAAAIHYPVPVHLQPAYAGRAQGALGQTERICRQILSLPLHPQMNKSETELVAALVGASLIPTEEIDHGAHANPSPPE
jgi:dTDP-4-amino-4,6-dideoxygalactose transaminase